MRLNARLDDDDYEQIEQYADQEGLKMPRATADAIRAGLDALGVDDDDNEHNSGEWVGPVRGMRVREPGEVDGPILEIHGEEGMAAMVFDDPPFVEGLNHATAEMNLLLEAEEDDSDE